MSPTFMFALFEDAFIITSAWVQFGSIQAIYSPSVFSASLSLTTILSIVNKYFLIISSEYSFSFPFSACTVILTILVSSGIVNFLVVLFISYSLSPILTYATSLEVTAVKSISFKSFGTIIW